MKLREIEILVQHQTEVLAAAGKEDDNLKEIQQILYSTEVCALDYTLHSPFTILCLP
jgi:hypothetical protein